MRRSLLVSFVLAIGFSAATAQPAPPAAPAEPAAAQPAAPAGEPQGIMPKIPLPDPPTCRLAGPPPPADPNKPAPGFESPMRQQCEDELSKDAAWWFNLQDRLRAQIHTQTSREIATNNRHVVLAYGAMWVLAVVFLVVMWRRQVALRAEIDRLARALAKAEGSGP